MRTAIKIALFVPFLAVTVFAANMSYIGKWKLNVAKSDFGATTVTYEPWESDGFKLTADGLSYRFKPDGKEYPTPWGSTAEWRSVDATTWEITNRSNGKVTSTDMMKLSADGKTMTVASKYMKVSGDSSDMTTVYERVSGTSGLPGKWKTANMTATAPGVMEISSKGGDDLTLAFVDQGGVCAAKLDGKSYPAKGPMWPSGWTCTLTKSGERGFDVKWSKDGKPMYKSTFAVSADGMSLTETGGAAATDEKNKAVYDRE